METSTTPLKTAVSWGAYPLTIIAVYSLHFFLLSKSVPLLTATYLPPAIAAAFIMYLEASIPYRQDWMPTKHDVGNDLIFVAVVQILLPSFLSFLVAQYVLVELNSLHQFLSSYWPHGWPVLLQAALMIVTADFFRYWVHRTAHTWLPLWRLHAVHHSPQKLYWLNTARFHPLEKSLQFLFDAFPFLFLGVSPEVLSLFYIFYSTNGFFQHSNTNVRLGVLNYLISGPEAHRWHHSRKVKESSSNFGNNVLIWDLFFGTHLLPKERAVAKLGLLDPEYPDDFLSQMKTPFDSHRGTAPSKNDHP